MRYQNILLSLLPGLVAGITPPSIQGMTLVWSDDFEGPAGASPDGNVWNVMDAIDTNNEVQAYTASNNNLQISGGGTIQFVSSEVEHWPLVLGPYRDEGFLDPEPGKITKLQASILMGSNAAVNKQGLWPAFWALGDAMRHGTEWPAAGEIDIFEQVNGLPVGYGTVHCGSVAGGPCFEPLGRPNPVAMPTEGFHTWSVTIDRTNADWQAQTLSWQLDGNTFGTLSGAAIGDASVWSTLAHSPLYMIMNVAIGGDWPGLPNDATLDGYGAMMEVQWVAVYSS